MMSLGHNEFISNAFSDKYLEDSDKTGVGSKSSKQQTQEFIKDILFRDILQDKFQSRIINCRRLCYHHQNNFVTTAMG